MDIKREYEKYLLFVETYYPKSSINEENNKLKLKEIIFAILKTINSLETYSYINKFPPNARHLIADLKMYFLRLLYILPVNDYYFIEALLRSISENLLRIVYSEAFPKEKIERIKKLQYRDLWKNGIKKTAIFTFYKSALSNVNNIYQQKSDTIHTNQSNYKNEIDYLVNLMIEGSQIKTKQLRSDVRTLSNFVIVDTRTLFDIKEQDLTLQQKVVLEQSK